MSIANILRRIGGNAAPAKHHMTAIIVAGGSGTRMGSTRPKQWLELDGMPVVVRTLLAFQAAKSVREIVVVARESDKLAYRDYKNIHGIEKLTAVVAGGETRQASVCAGLAAVSEKTDFLCIHDGARPLITPAQIDRVAIAAFQYRAAAAATPATDTVKLVNGKHIITETVDRSNVWLAQTPQIFKIELYRAALAVAEKDGLAVTDDCMLAEHAGFAVRLVDCGRENLKLTVPADIYMAEAILRARRELETEA